MATEVIYRETRRRYRWPEVQLNLWILVILASAGTVLGIFAWFITVQEQLEVGIPWYVSRLPATSAPAQDALLTICTQALHIRNRHRLPHPPLPPCNPDTGWPTDAHSWRHIPRRVYTLCAVADSSHRNRDTTLWVSGEHQRQLPGIRNRSGIQGCEH